MVKQNKFITKSFVLECSSGKTFAWEKSTGLSPAFPAEMEASKESIEAMPTPFFADRTAEKNTPTAGIRVQYASIHEKPLSAGRTFMPRLRAYNSGLALDLKSLCRWFYSGSGRQEICNK
ncbi:MAG: hypothetical protein K2X63_03685 [Burkholderiaceae bacterium]|nr:hypothetical protein [Burkholderiaceae bacterium]